MDSAEALENAYRQMGDCTPLDGDCGALCESACCQEDEDGQGGVWLLGPELETLSRVGWAKVDAHTDPAAPMLVCHGPCERSMRPLCCRVFPLAPVRGKDGLWTVRMDARARAMCPLVRSGLRGLNREFVRAARNAMRALAESEEGERMLCLWAQREAAFREPLW
ncbi:MAG: hypothetical protein PUD50_14255 [Eubacteriales bacterium]|nr:hypothetical protein [Eubacteriales bacterium]